MKNVILILLASFAGTSFAQQPGDLDATFDGDGKVTTNFSGWDDGARAVAIQPDGKIVAVGYTAPGNSWHIALARYNTDGSMDNSFGTFGKVTSDYTGDDDARSLAILPDGKIIVAGMVNYFSNIGIGKYNTDGSIGSFGTGGKKITDITPGNNEAVPLAIQADGKIIVAGASYNGTDADFVLARYNANGVTDTSFGTGGKVASAIGTSDDNVSSIVLQPDGKIIAAGDVFNGIDHDLALARFNTDGTLDSSFSGDGKMITTIGTDDDFINAIALQPDGKIVIAGESSSGANVDFALARFNTDGTLDNSFSGDGKLTTTIGASEDYAYSLAIQPDGKIVVVGTSGSVPNYDFALAYYNPDGSLDTTFSTDGKLTTSIGSEWDHAASVAIQSDGKIVVAGFSSNSTDDDFALARYFSSLNVGIVEFSESPNNILIYPNPLTQTAMLEYALQQEETLSIRLLDLQGKTIRTFLENTRQDAGQHQQAITLPESLPSGSYLIVIESAKGKMGVKVVK